MYISKKNMAKVIIVWYQLKLGLSRTFSGHLQVEYVNRFIILDGQSDTVIRPTRKGISDLVHFLVKGYRGGYTSKDC